MKLQEASDISETGDMLVEDVGYGCCTHRTGTGSKTDESQSWKPSLSNSCLQLCHRQLIGLYAYCTPGTGSKTSELNPIEHSKPFVYL
jgi:hypothetical protein